MLVAAQNVLLSFLSSSCSSSSSCARSSGSSSHSGASLHRANLALIACEDFVRHWARDVDTDTDTDTDTDVDTVTDTDTDTGREKASCNGNLENDTDAARGHSVSGGESIHALGGGEVLEGEGVVTGGSGGGGVSKSPSRLSAEEWSVVLGEDCPIAAVRFVVGGPVAESCSQAVTNKVRRARYAPHSTNTRYAPHSTTVRRARRRHELGIKSLRIPP
jgi:hypothetical protein